VKLLKNIKALTVAATVSTAALSGVAQADMMKRTFCIWDPVGANGPLYNVMKSAKPSAIKWGVDLELKAYTDEKIAAEDFKAGQCDTVLLTGTRAREFNKFTGSLEAIGALPSTEEMKMVLNTIVQPKAAKLMVNGNYEVAGILPAGAIYLYTRDRNIDTVEELQGKKVATLDYDKASMTMVRHIGASVVGSSTANFAGKFNNGSVDVAYAPAVAYTPLELYKGLGENGGVFDFPLSQMNFQILIHVDRFPTGYGQKVRDYTASRFEEAYKIVEVAEAEIKEKYWVRPSPENMEGYTKMLREVRISLRDEGVYDAKALRLMRKVRCKKDPANAECAEKRE
jgi:solute-binding AdeT-like protein